MKLHIWRYNTTMPASERPWIVTAVQNGEARPDADAFETWADAAAFAFGRKMEE